MIDLAVLGETRLEFVERFIFDGVFEREKGDLDGFPLHVPEKRGPISLGKCRS